MKMKSVIVFSVSLAAVTAAALYAVSVVSNENEDVHRKLDEAELHVGNLTGANVELYAAGLRLEEAVLRGKVSENTVWLPPGRYFLKAITSSRSMYYPLSLTGYRTGPDDERSLVVTIRTVPLEKPPLVLTESKPWEYIPSGSILFGDRRNPKETHYVWLTGFFIAPFEVTNAEFRSFLDSPDGYDEAGNWTEGGNQWRTENPSHASALLRPENEDWDRFGQADQPVTWVNWFEADAFCRWLTRTRGAGRWWFSLPNEAEWEKAARGPDGLDFSLSMQISDNEIGLYNWKKNPIAEVTVLGIDSTVAAFQSNRYGLFHMTGNVVEWTESVFRPFSAKDPFQNDERNRPDTEGLRVARGGSWYSASIAYMYIPYRDAFQPEHSTQDVGLRLVARPLP